MEDNTKKLGIDINYIAPKLKKTGINYNNDYYIEPFKIYNSFKSILSSKKREKEYIPKLNSTENNNLLIREEDFLKNSIINQHNDVDKPFSIKFKKNSSQYKMHQYNDLINSKVSKNNFIKQKIYLMNNTYNLNQDENIKYFDMDQYINTINNEQYLETSNEFNLKKQQKLKTFEDMKKVTYLIIDFFEQCYRSQQKLEEDLIEIPEYREWANYFIEGKSCLKIPIKRRRDKNKNDISKNEKDSGAITNNSSMLTKLTKKSEKKKEKKNGVNNKELISMEYNDYLFYRGNWDIDNIVDKKLYGNYLHIYTILGNEIFNYISSDKNLFQGLSSGILLKKSNSDFELKEEELNNIYVPKKNVSDSLLGEIILLNFDNISNEIINNNIITDLTKNISNELKFNSDNKIYEKANKNIEDKNIISNKEDILSNNKNNYDFSYIPIKLCIIGHSFSGRKTQAKLLSEKYKNLKSYSINDITKFYCDEYKRLHLPIEKQPKFKSIKKNQITQMKEQIEEELKKYNDIFKLIEKYLNIDKNKIEELNIDIEEISDELKIKLFLFEIQKDFPKKEENEELEQIKIRMQKKEKLEEEINKLKEEMDKETIRSNNTNNNNTKDNKKPKNKTKKNNNSNNNLLNLKTEFEKIINESVQGFILYDFPNNYNQYLQLENIITGFIQEIDKEPDKRDIYMNMLTNSIDKPYINISNVNNQLSNNNKNNYINKNININKRSFFNCYILLELSEEETLKRMNNRLIDPNTGTIYHKDYSPPDASDKKLNERLVPISEPNNEKIKDLLAQFYLEYPKITYFLYLFNNLYRIDLENKDEIFNKIENIILDEVKKYEERENKDTIVKLSNKNIEINYENENENEINKYFMRLNEVKKNISKDLSENIIRNWFDQQDIYNRKVKYFIKTFIELKNNILDQMNIYQEEFIDFINSSSKKYKLVDIFYKKYNDLIEKFPYLKNNHLVSEEFDKNINELVDSIWEIIQMRKRDSIDELNQIKKQNYIENQLDYFGNNIINLFILETNHYFNKINLIKKFYYEFEKAKMTEKFPYEYIFEESKILKDINEYPIFIPNSNSESNLLNSNEFIISPKIDKVYNNCYTLFFDYDKTIKSLQQKIKEEYAANTSEISINSKKRIKAFSKKTTIKSDKSNISDSKNGFTYEEEMKTALSNEKIKYKVRILFLKKFTEKLLKEIYDIGQTTFNILDNHIIESVNSQNDAMNELIYKIKKNIKEGIIKLNIKDVELDLFDIYEKSNVNFSQFNLNYLYSLPEKDKKINYNNLYMIYLDIKNFEIQNNYVNVNTVIDIVFKKYLFESKSKGFMNYMHKIPFCHLYTFLSKYIIKKDKGYSIIKLNELFTSLALLNRVPPKKEQQLSMMKSVNDKLKYKMYLSKNEFMNCKMWFEKYEHNIENNNIEGNDRVQSIYYNLRSSGIISNKNNYLEEAPLKDKKLKRSSIPNVNYINNSINKEISEENKLKELLFNINKNEDELIDFMDFMKRIIIKKNTNINRKKSTHFNDIKSNIDKADILSQNSFLESIDKTLMSESTTNYFKGSKNVLANNNISNNISNEKKEENKMKNNKSQKLNETLRDFSEEKVNNNINEIINFPEYTYFDYLFKKS